MKSIEIQIDESIYEKFLGFLDMLPKDKIKIIEEEMTEALCKVKNQSLQDLKDGHAIDWHDARKELGF